MNIDQFPDKKFSELQNNDEFDSELVDEPQDSMNEAMKMLQYVAMLHSCSWLFANDCITLREYIEYNEAYYEQYDGASNLTKTEVFLLSVL